MQLQIWPRKICTYCKNYDFEITAPFIFIKMAKEGYKGGCLKSCSEHEDDVAITSPHSGQILIPDVIAHLCKFLVIETIKQCRLVCKSWNSGATPVLKARTLIHIPFDSGNSDVRRPKKWRWDKGILEKLRFNVHLMISTYKSTQPPTNLETFPSVRNVKSISVHFYLPEQWQKDLCNKIVQTSATTLEELKLKFHYDQNFPSFYGTVFLKFKKLVTDWANFQSQPLIYPPLLGISQAITESFPGLQSLSINHAHLREMVKVDILQKFPL
ncbi:uncharacterized protein LOC118438749 isoform X1 [Folsomia candida]|nr:uncharacterized protein LOC118438749 isoform X1 [Folsomia candida]